MDWSRHLQGDERLLWQGRPAPRCYTFRNWKLALIGLCLFLLGSVWQMLGVQLATDGHAWYLAWIPAPLVCIAFILGPGQILLARIEWERLFYALTDRRVLIQYGVLKNRVRAIPREEITSWQQRRYGEQLASIRLLQAGGKGAPILHCLEQPHPLLAHLAAPERPATSQKESV